MRLVVNDTYIITLVALSEHLPSAIVGPIGLSYQLKHLSSIGQFLIWVIWKGMVW